MFLQGIINSPNPGLEFYNVLEEGLSGAGYTLVDTVVISSRTHKIWKSPATNIFGQEWFLDLTFETTGEANFWMTPFEDYDEVSDLGFRGPINYHNGAPLESDFSASGSTGYSLENALFWNPGYSASYYQVTWINMLSNDNMGYWVSITPDRVITMVSHDSQRLNYCGLFKPSPIYQQALGANLFPLVSGRVSTHMYSKDLLVVTRMPTTSMNEVFSLAVNDNLQPNVAVSGIGVPAGGAVLATPVSIGTWGGWVGSLYDVLSVCTGGDLQSGMADQIGGRVPVGRGDVASVNQVEGSSTPSSEWVLSSPRASSGVFSLLFKKV